MTPAPHIPPAPGVLDKLQRRTLMSVLKLVPDRLDDLEVTITRTDSMKPMNLGVTRGSEERSVPFNQAASDARVKLEKAVRTYALRVALVTGRPAPHGAARQSQYLLQALPGIPDDAPSIEGIYTAIVGASDKARRVVDSPMERKYIGTCKCGHSLFAINDAEETGCRKCGLRWTVAECRGYLLEEARDRVGTPETLARLLPHFDDRPIKANTIRAWAARGKLKPANAHGQYRIGDVIELHRASAPTPGQIATQEWANAQNYAA